jgi:hypothetical protein
VHFLRKDIPRFWSHCTGWSLLEFVLRWKIGVFSVIFTARSCFRSGGDGDGGGGGGDGGGGGGPVSSRFLGF